MCVPWLTVASGQRLFGYRRLGEILRVAIPGIRSHDILFPYSAGPTKSYLLHMSFGGDILVAEHEDGDGEIFVLCRLERSAWNSEAGLLGQTEGSSTMREITH